MEIPKYLKSKLRLGSKGSIVQDEFADIVLTEIYYSGGNAERHKIISTIHEIYSSQFAEADYELLNSQKPPKERWIHNIGHC